jgi:ABC-type transport system involved in cytochrome bd biosynthesis fused ATPase/permease subunit
VDITESHPDEELWDALERVGMKKTVNELPEKLDTVIEDGSSLSRGQVSLILFMRNIQVDRSSWCSLETIGMYGQSATAEEQNYCAR